MCARPQPYQVWIICKVCSGRQLILQAEPCYERDQLGFLLTETLPILIGDGVHKDRGKRRRAAWSLLVCCLTNKAISISTVSAPLCNKLHALKLAERNDKRSQLWQTERRMQRSQRREQPFAIIVNSGKGDRQRCQLRHVDAQKGQKHLVAGIEHLDGAQRRKVSAGKEVLYLPSPSGRRERVFEYVVKFQLCVG